MTEKLMGLAVVPAFSLKLKKREAIPAILRLVLLNFFAIISLFNLVFASEEALISEEILSKLGKPIQVNIVWARLDGKFEILNDFYIKTDVKPITKKELADKCTMKSLLPYLVNADPYCPLKMTVTARLASETEATDREGVITDFAVMDRDALEYYGFIERRK